MEIFLFALGAVGMTHILVDSDMPFIVWFRNIVDKHLPAKWSKLIHCYVCSGFWSGLFCGWAAFNTITFPQLFLAACTGSLLSNFAAIYMNYLEAQTMVSLPPDKEG
jgi:hypothetical protein